MQWTTASPLSLCLPHLALSFSLHLYFDSYLTSTCQEAKDMKSFIQTFQHSNACHKAVFLQSPSKTRSKEADKYPSFPDSLKGQIGLLQKTRYSISSLTSYPFSLLPSIRIYHQRRKLSTTQFSFPSNIREIPIPGAIPIWTTETLPVLSITLIAWSNYIIKPSYLAIESTKNITVPSTNQRN